MYCMFKDFRFLHFMASHRNNKKVLQFSDMVRKYYLSSTFNTHRQAASAAQALRGILDSPFINIWMPHERNITTWSEQKGADSPPPEENISFVSSMLLNGRTSCWIFSPFFLLSEAMLIFHSQTHSTSSTGYTWHVALRIILHLLRNVKRQTCWCCSKCLKGFSQGYPGVHHPTLWPFSIIWITMRFRWFKKLVWFRL